ncbi:MAG: isoprenylcysteine carboxylmethyltransferase family protein [Nitrospirota bacterium]
MDLKEHFEGSGNWLFRRRSYLPLVMVGLFAGMLFFYKAPPDETEIWDIVCLLISFAGLALRAYTVGFASWGTSGRNTQQQSADSLNTTGMYSVVRHPLYLGNFIIWFGLSLFFRQWWFSLIVSLSFWLYYERIMFAEEAYLKEKFGDRFSEWARRTPAFLPAFRLWERPVSPFSLRTILKREQSGFLAITASFTFLEVVGDCLTDGKFQVETVWIVFFFLSLLIFLSLTGLKKARLL